MSLTTIYIAFVVFIFANASAEVLKSDKLKVILSAMYQEDYRIPNYRSMSISLVDVPALSLNKSLLISVKEGYQLVRQEILVINQDNAGNVFAKPYQLKILDPYISSRLASMTLDEFKLSSENCTVNFDMTFQKVDANYLDCVQQAGYTVTYNCQNVNISIETKQLKRVKIPLIKNLPSYAEVCIS